MYKSMLAFLVVYGNYLFNYDSTCCVSTSLQEERHRLLSFPYFCGHHGRKIGLRFIYHCSPNLLSLVLFFQSRCYERHRTNGSFAIA